MDYSFCFTNIPDPDIVISVLISANVIYFVVELPWKFVSEMNWSYITDTRTRSDNTLRHILQQKYFPSLPSKYAFLILET